MKKLLLNIAQLIISFVDFFYPPFRKYMSVQFFRYAVTGTTNLVFDWIIYFFIYNFVLQHQMLELGFVTLSSHIATMLIKFPFILLSGFLLQKYITFTFSDLRGRVQLFRYAIVFGINLIFNYVGLKLLVDVCEFYPSISNMIITILSVFISYFSQKKYTFKVPKFQ